LRGEQTVGELRGRAARMESIADLGALRPILDSLIQKNLVVSLTPPGRGQVVTHNLFEPQEMARVKERAGSMATTATTESAQTVSRAAATSAVSKEQFDALQSEVDELRQTISELQRTVDQLRTLLS